MPEISEPPPLHKLFWASHDHADICMLAILTWIAACDGCIAPKEIQLLEKIADQHGSRQHLRQVIEVARLARDDDLELACHFLRAHFDRPQRRMFLRLAITMAIQDGHLTVSENHLLQFLADLLEVPPRTFSKLFHEIAHRPFPVAGDPSSIAWWHQREAGQQAQAPADNWGPDRPTHSTTATTNSTDSATPPAKPAEPLTDRAAALRLLGLPDDASAPAIHAAFRRLAKKRHPDRFTQLGPAAVSAATAAFEQLRQAYETLAPG